MGEVGRGDDERVDAVIGADTGERAVLLGVAAGPLLDLGCGALPALVPDVADSPELDVLGLRELLGPVHEPSASAAWAHDAKGNALVGAESGLGYE